MSRWQRGRATVAKLLTDPHLQRISGEMTDGQAWLDEGQNTVHGRAHRRHGPGKRAGPRLRRRPRKNRGLR